MFKAETGARVIYDRLGARVIRAGMHRFIFPEQGNLGEQVTKILPSLVLRQDLPPELTRIQQ